MYERKIKLERYLRVNLLGPGPRLIKKEFTGSRDRKSVGKGKSVMFRGGLGGRR
jgi:hypothetical protein